MRERNGDRLRVIDRGKDREIKRDRERHKER